MALHRLRADDFTSYATDAAFEAAYPYDPPTDLSTSVTSCDWGATAGPDGQPGIAKTGGSGTYGFDAVNLVPQGHLFRIEGRWGCPGTAGSAGYLLTLWWTDPGDRSGTFAGDLCNVSYATTGNLTLNGGGTTVVATAAVTPDVPFTLRLDGRRSTMTETSPGVWDPAADGWLKLYVDGVEVASIPTADVWLGDASVPVDLSGYYWNGVSFSTSGSLSDIEIWDERGSITAMVVGVTGTVTADRAVLFSLDSAVNVLDDVGKLKICGDFEVTGTTTLGTTTVAPGTIPLTDLSDVTITSPALAQALSYNGTAWVNTAPPIRIAEVTVSSASLKTLRATARTLVSAPGAGFLLEFVGGVLFLDATATAYVEAAANLAVRYTNTTGAIVSETIEATGFIDQTADTMTSMRPSLDAIVAKTGCENQALVLHNLGAGEYTTGTGVVRVKIGYRLWSTGW